MKSVLCTLLAFLTMPGGWSRLNDELEDSRHLAHTIPEWLEGFYLKPLPLAPPEEGPAQEESSESIDFEGTITKCDGSPFEGAVPFRSLGDPNIWDYWSVDLQAGRKVSIEVNRRSCGMDPAFYLFFNTGVIVGSGDDELPPPDTCPTDAPFRDAQLNISALPFTGQYVVGVFDNAGVAIGNEDEGSYNIRIDSEDKDGDEVGEACDRCPFTDLSKEIVIQDCETGVQDKLVTKDGCSVGDLLPGILKKCDKRALAKEEANEEYSFEACVNMRLRKLRKMSPYPHFKKQDQRDIMRCVAEADRQVIRETCGNRFYASDRNNLFIIDPATGRKQFVGRLPTCSAEIQYDDNRNLILNEKCGGSVISEVDPSNAGLIQTFPPHIRGPISGMELVGGVVFGTHVRRKTNPRLSSLISFEVKTSKFRVIGKTGKEAIPGLAYDNKSGKLFGVTGGNSQAELLDINMNTGKAKFMANVTTRQGNMLVNNIGSLDFGPDGQLYAGINENAEMWPSSLVVINTKNGKADLVGKSDVGYRGLTCYTL